MLPKKNRLIEKKDFNAVYQKGRTYSAPARDIMIKCAKNQILTTRIGFVVGKNYSKKATERNAAKRLLRAVFWENMAKITPGLDIIVLCNKKGANGPKINRLGVEEQVRQIIRRIK